MICVSLFESSFRFSDFAPSPRLRAYQRAVITFRTPSNPMNQSSNTITCRLCWDGVLHDLLLCNGVATHIKDNPQKHGGSSSIIGQKTYSNSSIQKNQRRRHATPTPSPQHHRATLSCNTVYCRLCDTHIEDNPTALQHHYNSVQHEKSLFDQSKTSSKSCLINLLTF